MCKQTSIVEKNASLLREKSQRFHKFDINSCFEQDQIEKIDHTVLLTFNVLSNNTVKIFFSKYALLKSGSI